MGLYAMLVRRSSTFCLYPQCWQGSLWSSIPVCFYAHLLSLSFMPCVPPQEALSAQLWGPALVLAQSLGASAFSEAVVAMTSALLQPGLPLHTWSLVTAGRADLVLPPSADSSVVMHPSHGSMALGGLPHMGMTHPGSSTAPWGTIGEQRFGLWFTQRNDIFWLFRQVPQRYINIAKLEAHVNL